jgi:nitrile hydratase beta subunit
MNGAHDMGGMQGFGPVVAESDEPVFHAEWERRIFALTLASGAMRQWNIDASRYARESQPPAQYLNNSYYQTWLVGLEKLLVENGIVSAEELRTGKAAGPLPADLAERVLKPERVSEALSRGDKFTVDADVPAKFTAGQRVRVRNMHPAGHTRAPRYVRGHVGIVDRDHGVFVFADANAAGNRIGEHCYSVRFEARELWGSEAPAHDVVHVDLWDDHLEPA